MAELAEQQKGPPDYLTGVGLRRWNEVWQCLDVERAPDRELVGMYCVYYSDWCDANAKIQDQGSVVEHGTGQMIVSPYVEVREAALEQMQRIGAILGLTHGPREAEPWSPFEPESSSE